VARLAGLALHGLGPGQQVGDDQVQHGIGLASSLQFSTA
jgi:hypothetical protein